MKNSILGGWALNDELDLLNDTVFVFVHVFDARSCVEGWWNVDRRVHEADK